MTAPAVILAICRANWPSTLMLIVFRRESRAVGVPVFDSPRRLRHVSVIKPRRCCFANGPVLQSEESKKMRRRSSWMVVSMLGSSSSIYGPTSAGDMRKRIPHTLEPRFCDICFVR